MRGKPNLKTISDDELLRRLADILSDSRRVEADLIAHIAEVDARKLYAREAAPSMFAYCTERLHLSEAEAWFRIRVARASRKHPMILPMVRDGRLHLTGVVILVPHLTVENRRELLARAVHKTKRQIEELIAEIAPREDAPAVVRKLPAQRGPGAATSAGTPGPEATREPAAQLTPETVGSSAAPKTPEGVGGTGSALSPGAVLRPGHEIHRDEADARVRELTPETVGSRTAPLAADGGAPARSARVEPLAPARYKVQFTADEELRDMLERLQALMLSSVSDGDLAAVIKVAVAEKIERLEAKRFARTKTPRKSLAQTDTTPRSRKIPAAVRRAVHERDGGRCTYRNAQGRRCSQRHDLEFHHRRPFGYGGEHSPDNVTLVCRAHNALAAEHDFGEEVAQGFRRSARRGSGSGGVRRAATVSGRQESTARSAPVDHPG